MPGPFTNTRQHFREWMAELPTQYVVIYVFERILDGRLSFPHRRPTPQKGRALFVEPHSNRPTVQTLSTCVEKRCAVFTIASRKISFRRHRIANPYWF